MHWPGHQVSHISGSDVFIGVLSTVAALACAAVGLFGRPLQAALPARLRDAALVSLHGLRRLHDGHIGDYIAWWTAGASAIGGACLITLR